MSEDAGTMEWTQPSHEILAGIKKMLEHMDYRLKVMEARINYIDHSIDQLKHLDKR